MEFERQIDILKGKRSRMGRGKWNVSVHLPLKNIKLVFAEGFRMLHAFSFQGRTLAAAVVAVV